MKCNGTTKDGTRCNNRIQEGEYCRHHKKHYEKAETCPICMEKMFQVKYPLECGHWVHKSCLKKFLTIKFQNEINRLYDGYMPNLDLECPICKKVLENNLVPTPFIKIVISKQTLIDIIETYSLAGQGEGQQNNTLEKIIFDNLVESNNIHDIQLAGVFFTISLIIKNMIESGFSDPNVQKLFPFKIQSPSNTSSPMFKLYDILTASDSSYLLIEYKF